MSVESALNNITDPNIVKYYRSLRNTDYLQEKVVAESGQIIPPQIISRGVKQKDTVFEITKPQLFAPKSSADKIDITYIIEPPLKMSGSDKLAGQDIKNIESYTDLQKRMEFLPRRA